MIYREYLVMRKAVLWLLIAFAACITLVEILSARGGHSSTNGSLTELSQPVVWFEMLFAGIFGVALGNASREPARVMWVLPKARWISALGVIGVDLAALVTAYFGLFVAMLVPLFLFSLIGITKVDVRWMLDPLVALRELGFVAAVYGWSALAGMLGRRVAYAGILAVPLGLFWEVMSGFDSSFAEFLRKFTIAANPFAVYSNVRAIGHAAHDPLVAQLSWITPQLEIAVFAAILVGTCAVAVAVWQRAEVVT